MKISIVIPIYNEEKNISELYRRLKVILVKDFPSFDYEILYVDDGSNDDSIKYLNDICLLDSKVKVLQFSRNFGHHIAITAGLDFAEGDFVVMMDGDLQDQPEEIIKLYSKIEEGYHVVFGVRQNKKFSFFRRFFSKCFLKLINFLIKEKIEINTEIFRIMTKQVVLEIKKLREQQRYVIGIVGWVGFRHIGVLVEHGERIYGESKYNLRKQLILAFDAIFSFSDYLLRFITYIGFLFVLLSFILLFYILFKTLIFGNPVQGWTSIVSVIFFVGGIQIFLLGIIGQYLGRVYLEVKGRPLYVIKNNINFHGQKGLEKFCDS